LTVRTRWPWISLLIAAVLVFNPVGFDILHATFFSAESLSRGIWRPIALAIGSIIALVVLLEWGLRAFVIRRRSRGKAAC
jgi:hypothetical protein